MRCGDDMRPRASGRQWLQAIFVMQPNRGQGFYYLDSDHPERDYGPAPYDIRHNLTRSAIYELRSITGVTLDTVERCDQRSTRSLASEHDFSGTYRPGADGHRFGRPVASVTAPRIDQHPDTFSAPRVVQLVVRFTY